MDMDWISSVIVSLLGAVLLWIALTLAYKPANTPKPATLSTSGALSVRVVYSTTKGRAKMFAEQLHALLTGAAFDSTLEGACPIQPLVDALDVSTVSADEYDIDNLPLEQVAIFILPTYEGGIPPKSGLPLFEHVQDAAKDFRVSKDWLSGTSIAVCGLGSSEYEPERFCAAARAFETSLLGLGASRLCGRMDGDESADMDAQFDAWMRRLAGGKLAAMAGVKASEIRSALLTASSSAGSEDDDALSTASSSAGSTGTGTTALSRSSRASAGSARSVRGREGPVQAALNETARAADEAAAKRRSLARAARLRAAQGGLALGEGEDGEEVAPVASAGEAEALEAIETARAEAEDALNRMLLDAEEAEAVAAGAAGDAAGASPSGAGDGLLDIEDVGSAVHKAEVARRAAAKAEHRAAAAAEADRPSMVTPAQRRQLTKEGYRVLGSHSAVKLCRWTKHSLRGRGMCYKQSGYGIKSYQCMELTPSLACANKCTFCWRHHTNPVGREWRWRTDPPDAIVRAGIEAHLKMIHEMKGVPGVRMDRFAEAHTVRHCALSLVGEPIMYPAINSLVAELHARDISTFLVTNAQFPAAIRALQPVTQLYVSIDAHDKDSLRKVDRPLFSDFWERFVDSLRALRRKRQRTVYRLTLVKRYNIGQGGHEMENYCRLVELGNPDIIEVKAVTYCGDSKASDLTIRDVPYHKEVRAFCEDMAERLGGRWRPAAEHSHSNCVILARTDTFFVDGRWHTWIDYDRFHSLVKRWQAANGSSPAPAAVDSGSAAAVTSASGAEPAVPVVAVTSDGSAFSFSAKDYMAPTPEWAVYDAPGGGFSPDDVRFRRTANGKAPQTTAGGDE